MAATTATTPLPTPAPSASSIALLLLLASSSFDSFFPSFSSSFVATATATETAEGGETFSSSSEGTCRSSSSSSTCASSSSSSSSSSARCGLYLAPSSTDSAAIGAYAPLSLRPSRNVPPAALLYPDVVLRASDVERNYLLHRRFVRSRLESSKDDDDGNEEEEGSFDGLRLWDSLADDGDGTTTTTTLLDADSIRSVSPGLTAGLLRSRRRGLGVGGATDDDDGDDVVSDLTTTEEEEESFPPPGGIHRRSSPGAGAMTYALDVPHRRRRSGGSEAEEETEPTEKEGEGEGEDDPFVEIGIYALPSSPGSDAAIATTEATPPRSRGRLESNGRCADRLRSGISSIPHAGRGAFATRDVAKGAVVAWAPVVPIRRDDLGIYATRPIWLDDEAEEEEEAVRTGEQLLLNYCFGHVDSTLLLFPHGPIVNFVNHGGREKSNVEVRWSTTTPSSGPTEWLDLTVEEVLRRRVAGGREGVASTGILAMEYVATKDVREGDEILIDYGDEWSGAWSSHVRKWKPVDGAERYVSASVANERLRRDGERKGVVRTTEEQEVDPYPGNLMTACSVPASEVVVDDDDDPEGSATIGGDDGRGGEGGATETVFEVPCDVLSRSDGPSPSYEVRLRLTPKKQGGEVEEEDDDGGDGPAIEETFLVRSVPRNSVRFRDVPYSVDRHLRSAFRREIGTPEGFFPRKWMDLLGDDDDDDVEQCRLYLAESSIPGSGWGMYTRSAIPKGSPIYYPDVVVQAEDPHLNLELRRKRRRIALERQGRLEDDEEGEAGEPVWALDSYYWDSRQTGATYDGDEIQSMVPGLGMLANSHTSLGNAVMRQPKVDGEGLDRYDDPGAGAFSSYHSLRYEAMSDIPPGMELFVEYGDDWFEEREWLLGAVPLRDDFRDADSVLERYREVVVGDNDGGIGSEWARDLWELTLQELSNDRIRVALPSSVDDVEEASRTGTALRSVPDAIRSPEWLKENGSCLDNLKPGPSTVRHAGRGAFATRALPEGTVVAPMPVVHVHRRHMEVFNYDGDDHDQIWFDGLQLLMNYCYGHPDSSLLLFPYSPVVNFVNHGGKEKSNAAVRWSDLPSRLPEWSKRTVEDLMREDHAGLVLEIVATRDIAQGEEVLIDYGEGWQRAWDDYLSRWVPPDKGDDPYVPARSYDDDAIVRTVREQEERPYPWNVVTVCFVDEDALVEVEGGRRGRGDDDFEEEGRRRPRYKWSAKNPKLLDFTDNTRPCDVLSREGDDDGREDATVHSTRPPLHGRYTIGLDGSDGEGPYVVRDVPRVAIRFVDDKYSADQFLRTGFRREIGVPEGTFPETWMDLKRRR